MTSQIAPSIQDEFMSAIDRIVANCPVEPSLAQLANAQRLKINTYTVSKEAGRSRTLLYREEYAEVKNRITSIQAQRKTSTKTWKQKEKRLKEEIRSGKELIRRALIDLADARYKLSNLADTHEQLIRANDLLRRENQALKIDRGPRAQTNLSN